MKEQIICIGCGAPIQTENKDKLGYAPPSSLKRDAVICQRCFRLKHYNEIQDVSLTDDDYRKIISGIGDTDALVVKIVDIFDFNGSWLPGIHRYIGRNKLMLVGNKVDLLPKSVNKNRLTQWMSSMAKDLGVKAEEVHLVSAAKGTGLLEVAERIDELREGKDVYVVGCTNVGKSTFINGLIKQLGTEQEDIITTSHFPGTTLNLIDIPLDAETALFDTPGIINHHQMAHFVGKDELKIIMPKKEIKPMVYQVNEGQTLFLGGLARFDYISGGRRSFVCHVSNELNIHRTKLENADELYKNHLGELLSPPSDPEKLPPLRRHEFKIKEQDTDVVFSGLGWITVKEPGALIAAYAPEGVAVTLRPSLI